jgi:hypothetical protein
MPSHLFIGNTENPVRRMSPHDGNETFELANRRCATMRVTLF